ncbi:MAG: amidohydrolase family protein [Planctomycetes bacterium]|nr:amidohydrolase family protein [Planctomycetota bacterium]
MSRAVESSPRAFRARYVFPVEGEPLRNGVVTIAGERILEVSRRAPSGTTDLGNVAILPGLVNAHTHLEYSGLPAPLGQPGEPFPRWLRQVIGMRRSGNIRPEWTGDGLQEAERTGTTTLGEIATSAWLSAVFDRSPLNTTVFYELLGLAEERIEPGLAAAREHLAGPQSGRLARGLTPHAPYTVHPELFARAVRLCSERRAPLTFHLAESREELELLRTGGGPLVELFQELEVWPPGVIPRGTRPLDYLRILADAPRTLLAHGNYLDAEEVVFVAEHADRMSVVYCPRTHAYFSHAPHPLAVLIQAGASVAIGTDSRASNPDLCMLSELRLIAQRYPQLSGQVVLELGTLRGARALAQAATAGSLGPGKYADLAIVRLPEHDARDPHELLFDGELPVQGTIWHGEWVSGPC